MVACMNPTLHNVAETLIELGANVNAYRPGTQLCCFLIFDTLCFIISSSTQIESFFINLDEVRIEGEGSGEKI